MQVQKRSRSPPSNRSITQQEEGKDEVHPSRLVKTRHTDGSPITPAPQ